MMPCRLPYVLLFCIFLLGAACKTAPEREVSDYHWREIIIDQRQKLLLSELDASDSMIVAVGKGGIMFSSDGLTWHNRVGFQRGQRVVWNDSAFYIFSPYGDLVSLGGKNWDTLSRANHSGFNFAGWFDTMFIASDDGMQIQACLYSRDGISWHSKYATVGHPFLGVVHRDSQYVAVGGRIMVSPDAMEWGNVEVSDEFGYLVSIACNDSIYVAVGGHGTILTSADAQYWQRVKTPTGRDLRSVVWNGEVFAAVGGKSENDAIILMSQNGLAWETVFEHSGGALLDIIWYQNRFIAVGVSNLIVVSDPLE